MKYMLMMLALAAFSSAAAANHCRPIYKAPVRISASGRHGALTFRHRSWVVRGNKLSPHQPADTLDYRNGSLYLRLIPVSSCRNGLTLRILTDDYKNQLLVPWNKKTLIVGSAGSNYYVYVIAKRLN